MRTKWIAAVAFAAVLGGGTMLYGQTTSELLQKGIYMQETLGDLDGAMAIYKQVAQMAKDSRANAAQAEYRLGLCLQKKGQQAEAAKVFQALITEYPDQTDVVAKAKALGPADATLKLLPAPWVDGELLELRMKIGNGKAVGSMRYSVQSSKTNPDRWLFETHTVNPMMHYFTRVEADRDTMKPIASGWFNYPVLGEVQISYQGNEARVQPKGKDVKTVALDGTVWDNEEAVAVMRRMPLSPGYKTTLAVVSPAGLVIKLGLSVTGVEDVQTAAGSFHCYRVELDTVNQKFYISTEPSRYLVKLDTGMVVVELQSVGLVGASQTASTYRNDKLGFSVTPPAGWFVDSYDALTGKEKAMVQLVDPDALASVTLRVEPVKPDVTPTAAAMQEKLQKDLSEDDDKKVRPDSWQTRQVGGRPAVSYLADVPGMFGAKMTEYTVQVRGVSTRADFSAKVDSNAFEAFRPRFDAIVDTLTLK
jgi:hypothetical protein